MNTTNLTGDLGGESSEIQSQIRAAGVTADTEDYMRKTGWEPFARMQVLEMWKVAEDVISTLLAYQNCAFTWSKDRKAIIVWRLL